MLESLREEWERLLRLAPELLIALLVVAVSVLIGALAARGVRAALRRRELPENYGAFLATLMRWALVLAGVTAALNMLGLEGVAASLVAGGGVTTIVLGFAFRGIGENLLAGLFLMMGRTFKHGDVIRSGDFEGRVVGIELRHTHIRASDGRDIFIPSYDLFSKPLVNYTRDGLRRFSFRIGLDYGDDIGRARDVLLESVRTGGQALDLPAPGVIIRSFEPNYVELEVFFWIDTFRRPAHLGHAPSAVMEACRRAVREAGFTLSSEVTTSVGLGGAVEIETRLRPAD